MKNDIRYVKIVEIEGVPERVPVLNQHLTLKIHFSVLLLFSDHCHVEYQIVLSRWTQERWSRDNYPPDVSINFPSLLQLKPILI